MFRVLDFSQSEHSYRYYNFFSDRVLFLTEIMVFLSNLLYFLPRFRYSYQSSFVPY